MHIKTDSYLNRLVATTAAWEQVLVNGERVKMQVDSGYDTTIISSQVRKMISQPSLDGPSTHPEDSDGQIFNSWVP